MNENSNEENELSLADIAKFIQESWKLLIYAGIVGAFLGLGISLLNKKFETQVFLENDRQYDIASWRMAENTLPNLVNKMLIDNAVPDNLDPSL